ncbi:S-adenosyl-L-methionine-dependent methyltransferase [Lichtheimia hyalospora FSU 10163]|nr:S-adenosyl-L-methionine-dependent methyltransferase [Lichtheimia hyalospora FSU 10163]
MITAKPKASNLLITNTCGPEYLSINNNKYTSAYFTRQQQEISSTCDDAAHTPRWVTTHSLTASSLQTSIHFTESQASSSATIPFDPLTNATDITIHHNNISSSSIINTIGHSKQKEIAAPAKCDGSFNKDNKEQSSQSTKPARKPKMKKKSATCLSTRNRSVDGTTVLYTRKTLPTKLKKYYFQRYSLFSKFDEGIMMDEEGWFSVTPEKIACHIAKRCTSNVIIDAFCGCGGNTIQFAFTCQQVIAIDIDPIKLHCARNNARIYGVEHKIKFILGDFFELAPQLKADAIFLSPPWGGPSYSKAPNYDLASMMPRDGVQIHSIASRITPNVAFYVPKNTDPLQLERLGPCEIERNSIQEHPKALTAYYGNLCRLASTISQSNL